jgi:hypothetical protein
MVDIRSLFKVSCISQCLNSGRDFQIRKLLIFLFSTFCLETKGGAKNSRLLLFRLKNSHRPAYFRNLPSLWLRLRTAGSRLRPISNFSSRQKSKGRKCPREDNAFCKTLYLDGVFLSFFSALNWHKISDGVHKKYRYLKP